MHMQKYIELYMFFSFFLMITQLHIFESLARVNAEDPEMIPIKPTINNRALSVIV